MWLSWEGWAKDMVIIDMLKQFKTYVIFVYIIQSFG